MPDELTDGRYKTQRWQRKYNKDLYIGKPIDYTEEGWKERLYQNWKDLIQRDLRAKKKDRLVGRYITVCGNGKFSVYLITDEGRFKVRVHFVEGLSPAEEVFGPWGYCTYLSKSKAERYIQLREQREKVFTYGIKAERHK